MDPTYQLVLIDAAIILTAVCIIDPNVLRAIGLASAALPAYLERAALGVSLRFRLWLDRQSILHRGPIGRAWNSYSLWRIRTNPAYREFFNR